jgi:hypothetical protein
MQYDEAAWLAVCAALQLAPAADACLRLLQLLAHTHAEAKYGKVALTKMLHSADN